MKNITNQTITSGGVILNEHNEIVIVNQNHDSWSLPKGHVEKNETLIEAANREIYEETGLKNISFIKNLGYYDRFRIGLDGKDDLTESKRIHLFLFFCKKQKLQPIDPLNPEAIWTSQKNAIKCLTHPKDKSFLENLITNRNIKIN
tara:strand:+ start:169 stop:606 length:438 start_codon:yes stop_codon:yes gene_type:complete